MKPDKDLIISTEIQWDFYSANLNASSYQTLDKIAEFLGLHENIGLKAIVYNTIDPEYSERWLNRRIEPLRDYLLAKQVNPAQLEIAGIDIEISEPWDFRYKRFVLLEFYERK
ncbi:hypothetical protein QQ020_07565 [Fulvivirgaceae bacterium BMA12]|uniref:Uncharacterized protein n=1 Tax=Agaribacillus aureus TaxID=3051825 RepID=A0ABT8L2H0_9BACT|nr:hypothetical protein [Fulvivirgaceae bacterium BMA12]